MRTTTALPLLLASLLAAATTAQTGVVRLLPVADATADQDNPTVNYGSNAELNFGKAYESTPTFRVWFLRGHVQFDLTPYATVPAPDRVRLVWYQSRSSAAGCLDVTAHRITSPWTEGSVTWNNKPSHDAAVSARACVGDSFNLGWKTFDVTALAQGWIAGSYPNLGLVIRDASESTAGAARPGFGHSRESTQAALRPHLELSWGSLPFGAGCAATTQIPQLDLSDGAPGIGGRYELTASGLTRSSAALHFIGYSNTSWSGLPLPFSLAALGFANCNLLVSGQVIVTGPVGTNGRVAYGMPVPNDVALRGARIYHQVMGITVAPAVAVVMTNGFQATVF